jgi:hypothetical protein
VAPFLAGVKETYSLNDRMNNCDCYCDLFRCYGHVVIFCHFVHDAQIHIGWMFGHLQREKKYVRNNESQVGE